MAKIAVIETGGKQYIVEDGVALKVEKLLKKSEKDTAVTFDKVLLTDDGTTTKVGAPYLSGETVKADIEREGRAKKVVVLRYRQKSRYKKKKGHRQAFSQVKVKTV